MSKQRKFAKAYVREVGNDDGLLVAVIGSTASVDRYGEIIDQGSWDLKHFKKNPVILWAHNLTLGEDRPPIGKAVKVGVKEDKLVFNIQFDMADPFAADIFRKYKEGYLSAFSVGFIPHTIQRFDENGEQLEAPVLKDNELLELSAVPVPANPEALNALRQRSFKTKSWEILMKEVKAEEEESGTPEEEDNGDIPTDPEDKPEDIKPEDENPKGDEPEKTEEEVKTEAIADKVIEKITPQLTKTITDVVSKAVNGNSEDKGGSDSDPKNTLLGGGSQNVVRVLRVATKMFQQALAEHNKAVKQPTR